MKCIFTALGLAVTMILGGVAVAEASDHSSVTLVIDASVASSVTPDSSSSAERIISDPWISRDKSLHLSVSAGLVGVSFYGFHQGLEREKGQARLLAVLSTAAIGLLKEERDRCSPKSFFSVKDLIADCVGIAIGVILFTL